MLFVFVLLHFSVIRDLTHNMTFAYIVERSCCREVRLLPKRRLVFGIKQCCRRTGLHLNLDPMTFMCLGFPLLRPNQFHFKFQYSIYLELYLIYTTTIILRLALVY